MKREILDKLDLFDDLINFAKVESVQPQVDTSREFRPRRKINLFLDGIQLFLKKMSAQ